jgi:hypothetical protein
VKRRIALAFVAVIILMVSECAAAGPKFVEEPGIPEGKALIYLYCPKAYYGSPVDVEVLANEEPVVVLKQGYYFPYITAPGRIDFAGVQRSTQVTLDAEAGHEYFVRIGTGIKRWEFMAVHREKAMSEITACRLPDSPGE